MRPTGLDYAFPAVCVLLVLLIVTAFVDGSFLAPGNWSASLLVLAPFVLVSMAQTPAMMSGNGGLDLSVGPTASVTGAVVVAKLGPHGVTSPVAVVPIVLAIGALVGLANGVMIAYVRIPPIVATLGSYLVLAALAIEILPNAGGTAPSWVVDLAGNVVGPIPGTLWLVLGVAAIWLALQRSAFRRSLIAVGGDQRTAFASGVDVARARVLAYVLSGTFAAVAGLAFVALLGAGDPTVPTSYTLISLAGATLGGVTLAGGRGGLLGAGAGGMVLFLIQNTLGAVHVNAFYTQMTYGVALLAALAINAALDASRKRVRGTTA
jgi:ribose transport system permease protein